MQRHIELKVLNIENGEVTFIISKQTHFCDRFTPNGSNYIADNGQRMRSEYDDGPRYSNGREVFYVHDSHVDETEINCTEDRFKLITAAVEEYNLAFPDKPMVINSSGSIRKKGMAERNCYNIDEDD